MNGKHKKIEEVIFLGAGASAADGASTQHMLFKDYFENYTPDHPWDNDLRQFFMDFFGINTIDNLNHADFPTFEEVLGILEISLNRYESFKNYPLIPQDPKVQKIREQIIFLIARTLKDKLRDGRPNHDALISRMKRHQLRTTAFVSLNYDILIDNALTEKNDLIDLDYGIQFTNFDKKGDWHKPHVNRTTKLFKLHGSLNWLYCPTCISLTITPKEKSVAALYHSTIADTPINCQCCQTKMIPIIIPPTFFKVMSNHFLQQIWRETEKVLMETKRIVFCGYSFPDADVHIKYLLKRVEVNRGTTPEIYIFNNHIGKPGEIKQQEKKRYERFFAEKRKVNYLDKSFEDFCNDGIIS